ncbi:hypothetical protein NSZ01_30380 [Nocardioides szechwanensis]|uniref:Uncharacterized protein n=1 Tax=Nocardioides szechwanensis TaxID=1005944 RepID=A0A1H0DXF4_9ACTN|nr:hypothetical protein [Nocardioides szechwanensis]GEP35270.1 hypothetical protein NSZ01_30380 [Nocardioides szechwanensis]SDN74779.1 hypothetical protein SAMN05192576_2696 [Nocardioides szechwanensis]
MRSRFEGQIAGVGSTSGTRIVVGNWRSTPLGPFSDAMVELADGHRVLLADHAEAADFIAATYTFDEIRVEPVVVSVAGGTWRLRSTSLDLDLTVGRRTSLGWALRAVPGPVASAPWWCSVTDAVARRLLTGVRTKGTAGNGRREWYGATDSRRVVAMTGSFEGQDLGALAPVDPPATFGFSSTPKRPCVTTVVTTVEAPSQG